MAGKVMVGCKHPNGLILEVTDKSGAARRVVVKGNARVYGVEPATVGGYVLTEVDADLWEAWLAKYKDCSLVKDGIVFAAPGKDAEKAAEEKGADVADLNPPLDPATAVPGVEKAQMTE